MQLAPNNQPEEDNSSDHDNGFIWPQVPEGDNSNDHDNGFIWPQVPQGDNSSDHDNGFIWPQVPEGDNSSDHDNGFIWPQVPEGNNSSDHDNGFICPVPIGMAPVNVEIRAIQMDLVKQNNALPIHWIDLNKAIEEGKEDDFIMGLLRGGKRFLSRQDHHGKTLIHAAVATFGIGPLTKIVDFMISNDMTDATFSRDTFGNTPLHWAVENKESSKARCLIKAEPRTVYHFNDAEVSPLYIAVKDGQHDLVKYMVSQLCLYESASEILWHPTHATLAHLAIKTRSFGILETLMEHLPDLIKSTNDKGWRPLSYAANKGYVEEVTYFLKNFPKSADKHDEDGSFPIHKAVGGGHLSVIKAFYEICPQALHQIDRKGRNVLLIAVSYKRAEIYTYLTKELKLDDFFSSLQDNEGKTFKDYEEELKI